MDYMLTPREQEVLYYAYFRGYYDAPRRVSLEELSRELGIAKSTLNEILRSAERKIVTAYMRHDLPHLILRRVLEKNTKAKIKNAEFQHRRLKLDTHDTSCLNHLIINVEYTRRAPANSHN